MIRYTVEPNDMISYSPGNDSELFGVVLQHHDDVGIYSAIRTMPRPGCSIYWQPSCLLTYWDYQGIAMEISSGCMKVNK